jgi:alpha-ketoglutarate-dependent taurine dioxygenase
MATIAKTRFSIEPVKPHIGGIVHVAKEDLLNDDVIAAVLEAIEERGVLVFPQVNLTDKEQLAFTDKLGDRVNFTRTAPGGDVDTQDVYTITLDKDKNDEPEYVLGTFFWHMDGATMDMPPPKLSILSCRKTSPKGGQTEFASTYAGYSELPEDEKKELEGVRVVHSVTAAVREVAKPEDLEPMKRGFKAEHPLVWRHKSGRKSLLIGYTADTVVGRSLAHGRALLTRLLEWTAQPDFTYRHQWQEGDLVVWDNCGALHRVVPYAEDSGRTMHRTSVAGIDKIS